MPTYRAGVAAFQRAIVDDPPAIFLAWSERARAVSTRFDVPVEPGRDILSTLRSGGRRRSPGRRLALSMAEVRVSAHRRRFALILALAAVVPLVAYGVVSLLSLQRGTRDSVVAGNLNVAARAAEEIRRYVSGHAEILKALGADLQDTGLEPWQQDRILKNYVLQFREFRELTLFDEAPRRRHEPRRHAARVDPGRRAVTLDGVAMSPIRVDDDQLPTSVFAVSLTPPESTGRLAGRRVQPRRNVADGRPHPHRPARLRAGRRARRHADRARRSRQEGAGRAGGDIPDIRSSARAGDRRGWQYPDEAGTELLAVGAPIEPLGWTVIVEQPTSEAYANAPRLQRQLSSPSPSRCCVMIAVGLVFGRRFIAPIFALQRATQAVAAGQLETRVHIDAATSSAISAQRSTRWPTGWSSCRKTSSGRSGRRCSAGSPPASSTTCRIRSRTSATAPGCCCATTSTPSRARCSSGPSSASSRR